MERERLLAHPAITLLKELLEIPSPPQFEFGMAAKIREKLAVIGYDHSVDGAGNILVPLESDNPGLPLTVIAAHMDELGFTVVGIEEDGKLQIIPSGRIELVKTGERPVTILGSRQQIHGIISLGSSHQAPRDAVPTWSDARVITGLSPAELQMAGVTIGTAMTIAAEGRGPYFLGHGDDPLVAAWTFDDRMGCITLLRLLEQIKKTNMRLQRPLLVAFTTHEEGSCHGAMSLCQRLKPEIILAVDGCPVTQAMPLTLDGRPGLWARDAKAIYDPRLILEIAAAAEAIGVEPQRTVYQNASSDASAAYAVGAVQRAAVFGHVRTNSHGFEVARLSVFDNVLKVLTRWLTEFGPES